MRWSRGEDAEAERDWGWACDKINSGVLSVGLYELNPVDDPVSQLHMFIAVCRVEGGYIVSSKAPGFYYQPLNPIMK
jgi:hypothetical protein